MRVRGEARWEIFFKDLVGPGLAPASCILNIKADAKNQHLTSKQTNQDDTKNPRTTARETKKAGTSPGPTLLAPV